MALSFNFSQSKGHKEREAKGSPRGMGGCTPLPGGVSEETFGGYWSRPCPAAESLPLHSLLIRSSLQPLFTARTRDPTAHSQKTKKGKGLRRCFRLQEKRSVVPVSLVGVRVRKQPLLSQRGVPTVCRSLSPTGGSSSLLAEGDQTDV